MKLLFVINLFALINSVFCSKDRGKYLEISNGKQTAYITVDECKNMYVCLGIREAGFFFYI